MNILSINLLQDAAPQQGNFMPLVMIIAMIAVFYFLMWRPQRKRQKELQKFQIGFVPGLLAGFGADPVDDAGDPGGLEMLQDADPLVALLNIKIAKIFIANNRRANTTFLYYADSFRRFLVGHGYSDYITARKLQGFYAGFDASEPASDILVFSERDFFSIFFPGLLHVCLDGSLILAMYKHRSVLDVKKICKCIT